MMLIGGGLFGVKDLASSGGAVRQCPFVSLCLSVCLFWKNDAEEEWISAALAVS